MTCERSRVEPMAPAQKIVPCLWCADNADEAVAFWLDVFGAGVECAELHRTRYPTEGLADFQAEMAGKTLTVEFSIGGLRLAALNGGGEIPPSPMLSFIVNFDPSRDPSAAEHIDEAWDRLADGGTVLMEIGEQPYSPRYGWVQDRFGASWQLMLTNPDGEPRPFLIPCLMFANQNANRANEAINFYTSLFPDTHVGLVHTYPDKHGDAEAGSVMFGAFAVGEQWFAAMDSPIPHHFDFNESISLQIECADQAEIDRYWSQLSRVPESEQCGWCKDQFGISWQVVPTAIDQMLTPQNWATMMGMTKIELGAFSS